MKTTTSFFLIITLALSVGIALLPVHVLGDTAGYTQTINLQSGWNVVSTPRVVQSHSFSAAEISSNFDIYVLNPQVSSGWSTLAELGQTEFTPLFGYFINNKTGSKQTLTLTYKTDVAPNARLFERNFTKAGWYSIGPAQPTYTKTQCADVSDTDNPAPILQSLAGKYDQVIDFAGATASTNHVSVAVEQNWTSVVPADINKIIDLRETKGYAVYINQAGAILNGFQNNDPVSSCPDIPTGTLSVSTSDTVPSANVTVGNNQILGAFKFVANGEPITITALNLTVASTTSGTITEDAAQSFHLVDEDGTTVAGPKDITNNALTVAFTDSFTVPVGSHVYKILATLSTSGGWSTDDTIKVGINSPATAITAKGKTTDQPITPTPSTNTTAAQQTVKTAKLTVTKNSTPANKTVIANSTNVLMGSWNFDATNSGEDVRVTSIAIRASTTGKFNNLTLKSGGVTLNPINDSPVTNNNANTTSTFALTNPLVITKGTSANVDFYGDTGSGANGGEVDSWGLTDTNATTNSSVVAYGVSTGNRATVALTPNDGALLTIAAGGTLTVDLDASTPATRKVVHGTTGISLSEVRLKATNESIDITRLIVRIEDGGLTGTNDGTYAQVAKVVLKLDGSVIGNANGYTLGAASTAINFERDQLTIPEGTTGKKLSILGDIVNIGTNQPGVANADIKVGLNGKNAFQAIGNGSNSTNVTKTYNNSTGSAIILHKSVPSVVLETPTNKLSGTPVLHRMKISAVGNTIGIYALSYVFNSTTGLSITNAYTKLVSCGTCGGIADGSQLAAAATPTYLIDGYATVNLPVDINQSHGKRYLAIPAGATAVIDLYATVTGFQANNTDSISTSLLGDTATSTNDLNGNPAAAFVVNNQGNFIWSDLNGDDTQNAASLTTKQWYNGYFVAGLGATATTTAETVSE